MSYRATYYVTVMVEAPLNAETFEQALEQAKKKEWKKLVKLQSGCEACDWQVQLYNVSDQNVNGEM